ncbi:hypothetical protein LBMAG53_06750 [Planctomycetota bacterium]|nr:hypothetical protein LBMAG53_06750 [Planctomycetota bacterium]
MKCPVFLALVVCSGLGAGESVAVSLTGRCLRVNGFEAIPRGIFGVHAAPVTPESAADLGIECTRHIITQPGASSGIFTRDGILDPARSKLPVFIDCQGDRFQRPQCLRSPSTWKEQCSEVGRKQGELWRRITAETGQLGATQWWNEPYLNWAERSAGGAASTINQECYDLDKAVEGGPVTIKGWSEPLTHFRWRGRWPVRYRERTDAKTGKATQDRVIGWSVPMPADAKIGDKVRGSANRYWAEPGVEYEWTIEQIWYPVDPTAVGYWSGRQNLDFYRWTFAPWAQSLRAANPAVTILAGWDFNYDAGYWSAWSELYRPLLKEFPTLIDGLTEHHYGIPPERVQAWYEVGTADAWAITGRFLRNWNTECQGVLDPAVYGGSSNASGEETAEKRLWEASYSLADVIGMCARMPDKVGSRTVHNFAGSSWWSECGAAWALRLLKPLRGRLLEVADHDDRLYIAAAWRAEGTGSIALYNQRTDAVDVRLDLKTVLPPARAKNPASTVTMRFLSSDECGLLEIKETPLLMDADGVVNVPLASRTGVLLTTGRLTVAGTVERQQFFAKEGALHRSTAIDQPLTQTINLPAAVLKAADSFALRIMVDGPTDGATLTVNGEPVVWSQHLPVTDVQLMPKQLVSGDNVIVVRLPKDSILGTASVLIDTVLP